MNACKVTRILICIVFTTNVFAREIGFMAKSKEAKGQMSLGFEEENFCYDPMKVRMDVRGRKTLTSVEEELLRLSELEAFAPVEVWTAMGTNKQLAYSTHGLFRYFGKFPPPVATYLMDQYTVQGDVVFDPMSGSGTTGVEALLKKRRCILNDVSPLSVLLASVKTTALDECVLTNVLNGIVRSYKPLTVSEYNFEPSTLRNHEHWFLPETENSLRGIKKLVEEIQDEDVKRFFRVCFLSVVRRVSRATTQQGRLFLDAETAEADALPFFQKKTIENIKAVAALPKDKDFKPEVYSMDLRAGIPTNAVGNASLIICHPPYFNSYKYSSINSLELAWMGEEYAQLRKSEVREFFKVGKEENADVYVNDIVSVLLNLKPALKKNAVLALMIGDTIIHGNYIPCTKRILEKAAKDYDVRKVVMRAPKYTEASWAASQRRSGGQVGVTLYDFIILLTPKGVQSDSHTSRENTSSKDCEPVKAKTHSAEYLLHKYWARKPHNVVSEMIKRYSPENGVVVDPCCGSGVVVYEAKKMGRTAYGFDVNPVACKIASVLINPPEVEKFVNCITGLLDELEGDIGMSYAGNEKPIKYCIHDIVVQCKKCGASVSYGEAAGTEKSKTCPSCQAKLKFNLENLADTKIVGVVFEGEDEVCHDEAVLSKQAELSRTAQHKELLGKYDIPFEENRRILAFAGLSTRKLFTDRNFSLICLLADKIGAIKDEMMRDAAQEFLTASVAQCSRLIASRNNLKTGGPAWSIPGFWVPARHLETNPIFHFRARLKKFDKGLRMLNAQQNDAFAKIVNEDGAVGMDDLRIKGARANMIFFDPPYGDSVPYMEFSALWNSFIAGKTDVGKDISVSDRMEKSESWRRYEVGLKRIVESAYKLLADDGRVVVTFNNNDMKAWQALLKTFQQHGFRCEKAIYQDPAVVSSKAQKAIDGSYVSDFYCVFVKSNAKCSELSSVRSWLDTRQCFKEDKQSEIAMRRELMSYWLNANVNAEALDQFDDLLKIMHEREGSCSEQ